jgi:hypothetical protein
VLTTSLIAITRLQSYALTTIIMSLPVVNLDAFLASPLSEEAAQECRRTAEALASYGALIVKDSRVTEKESDEFLVRLSWVLFRPHLIDRLFIYFVEIQDLMEDYFAQPRKALERDMRPELAYQGSRYVLSLLPFPTYVDSSHGLFSQSDLLLKIRRSRDARLM